MALNSVSISEVAKGVYIYYITYSKAAAKLLFLYFLDDGVYFNNTTCGPSAFIRGPGQKIVAFSIYGNLSSDKSRERGLFYLIVN